VSTRLFALLLGLLVGFGSGSLAGVLVGENA
jgi:hypothetical protein